MKANGELPPFGSTNRILGSLRNFSQETTSLESVSLQSGAVLQEVGQPTDHVYFPSKGLVSLLCVQEGGRAIEVGLIGCEGMVGVPAILGGNSPYRAVVQIGGEALRMRSSNIIQEFRRNGRLHDVLLRYTNTILLQITQQSVCNCYHTIEERICRWLLTARDGSQSNILYVTHDLIANLLGARRAGVTVAAGILQRAGLIKMTRGTIRILDSKGLQARACECYTVVRDGMRTSSMN